MKLFFFFFLLFGYSYSQSMNDSLLAYYPFNGNADDQSGNGNHASVFGASLVQDRYGNSLSAYSFDGIDDFINLNITQRPVFSISLWFNGSKGALISTHESLDNHNNFFLQINGYGCGIAVRGIEGLWVNDMCADTSGSYVDDEWHFITFTTNNGDHKLYVDGELESTLMGNPLTDERSYILGRREATGNYPGFYTGTLDEVRIYNKVLSASEVLNLMIIKSFQILLLILLLEPVHLQFIFQINQKR